MSVMSYLIYSYYLHIEYTCKNKEMKGKYVGYGNVQTD